MRAGRFGRTATIEADAQGEWLITRGKVLGRETELRNKLTPLYYELGPRFADMERMGVAHQVLSIGPAMTLYTLEAEANKELAASLNDGLTALARSIPINSPAWPRRPFRRPRPAADELARAKANGHLGVMIASNVAGKNIDDQDLGRLLDQGRGARNARVRTPHERAWFRGSSQGFLFEEFHRNPLDTTIAVACLIFGGVMDRFPKLKFYLSHVGGFVPWIRGRWQHGYGERREPKVYGAKDPEEYFGRFYYDTIIHNADAFEFAAKTLGVERILYGTDYPADMGYHQPARDIPGLNRLSESEQEMILTGNARRVYGLAI